MAPATRCGRAPGVSPARRGRRCTDIDPVPARPVAKAVSGPPSARGELAADEERARAQAISWVVQQVSRTAVVSCDSLVCNDLANLGFPDTDTLGPGSSDPLGSSVIVATPGVRDQFGPRLATVFAPALLATFGAGKARVEVRYQFPGGALAYYRALATGMRARKRADAQLLLASNRIAVSGIAMEQLHSGDIDPRLPQLIVALANGLPMRIVAFGDRAPGGGPADLLRSVELATQVSGSHLGPPAYLQSMQGLVNAQRAEYRPLSQQVTLSSGQTVLRIQYQAPSPLG